MPAKGTGGACPGPPEGRARHAEEQASTRPVNSLSTPRRSSGGRAAEGNPAATQKYGHGPAMTLMRAIISSTAWSTGTFSLTTRFIALAQTFSLLTIVNL